MNLGRVPLGIYGAAIGVFQLVGAFRRAARGAAAHRDPGRAHETPTQDPGRQGDPCTPEHLQDGLRRRDLAVSPSGRWDELRDCRSTARW